MTCWQPRWCRPADPRPSGQRVVLVSGYPGLERPPWSRRSPATLPICISGSPEANATKLGRPIPARPSSAVPGGRDPLIAAADFEALTRVDGQPAGARRPRAGHLQTVAATDRVLIAVDDVQWADPVSRYALHALISRLAGWPVAWVLASRSTPRCHRSCRGHGRGRAPIPAAHRAVRSVTSHEIVWGAALVTTTRTRTPPAATRFWPHRSRRA